jgi:RHS repeat-associated protein
VEDRLVRVENEIDSVIAKYYYDPFGRRLWKEVDSVRTYFLYSDEGLIGEYDQNGAEIRSYGYAPNSIWTTDPLFVKSANAYYWYQNDHAGTPQKIIDTSGRVVWSAVYDSFGNIQIETAEIVNNLRFAGQYHDAETGLYYNLNRYYDPATGRYLRTDPYGDGLNLFAYVFNRPNNFIDPQGLCAVKRTWQSGLSWAKTIGNNIIELLSPNEAFAGEFGLKEFEEYDEDIQRRETGYAKIIVNYEEVPGSNAISSIIELFGLLLKGSSIPFGHLKRKVYIEKEYARYYVMTITNKRTGISKEYLQKIPGTEYPSKVNGGLPVYEDVISWPTSVLIPTPSVYNFGFWTHNDLIDRDIEAVIESQAPGSVVKPVGFEGLT